VNSRKKSKISGVIKTGQLSLSSKLEQKQMAAIICARDHINNGMTRNECIQMIMDVTQATTFLQAKNHYTYLMKNELLPQVTKNTDKIQRTTTKRIQVTIGVQLHWYGLIEDIWREQCLLNLLHCHITFLHPHFMLN
jgi:hypothetical protein